MSPSHTHTYLNRARRTVEQQPQTEYFRLFQVNDQIKKVQGFI